MNRFDSVVVFVDALPFAERGRLTSMGEVFEWYRPVQPGFGYSINVKSELFAGMRPDEAGFLNEWGYSPGAGYKWAELLAPLDNWLSSNRTLRRCINKVLSRAVGESLRNIPLLFLDSVFRTGATAYEYTYDSPTVFSQHDVSRYLYSENSGDEEAFQKLCNDLQTEGKPISAFLAMAELDHIMHRDGKGSLAYEKEIEKIDQKLNGIWKLLRARDRAPRLLLVSDHGMAKVETEVSFDIGNHILGPGRRYGYFVDATMARIWILDQEAREEILHWLSSANLNAQVLSNEDRALWGITSPNFGDVIVLLDEGVMFAPNFFSDFACKAMHGYWPTLKSQQGLIASNMQLDSFGDDVAIRAIEAHECINRFYGQAELTHRVPIRLSKSN